MQASAGGGPTPRCPPADAPRDVSISTFLENRSGRVGIVLCSADSHPPATIALYRRGHLLATSLATAPGGRVTPSHNSLRLELGAVGAQDAGDYTCVATNPLGNATASAHFDVRSEWGSEPPGAVPELRGRWELGWKSYFRAVGVSRSGLGRSRVFRRKGKCFFSARIGYFLSRSFSLEDPGWDFMKGLKKKQKIESNAAEWSKK